MRHKLNGITDTAFLPFIHLEISIRNWYLHQRQKQNKHLLDRFEQLHQRNSFQSFLPENINLISMSKKFGNNFRDSGIELGMFRNRSAH